ncbi:MAG: class IV adenylate cyclase [Anaerolineaceae bacterium]
MSSIMQEFESKFYVHDLEAVETRLRELGGTSLVPRGFEYNLRFDDSNGSLQLQGRVLRLRKYDDIRVTLKGPGERIGGTLARTEIELIVNDFDTAKEFLEGLGYSMAVVCEKYRAMYKLDTALITFDELPYGKFVEIEDENPEKISELAQKLGLKPETAVSVSYQELFEQLKTSQNLPARNLVFREFGCINLMAADLGVESAD